MTLAVIEPDDFLMDYGRSHSRVAHGDLVQKGNLRGLRHNVVFPMSTDTGYEIGRDGLRSIAGGARLPQAVLPKHNNNRLRASFREKVKTKRRWTEAVETEIVYADFSLRKIVVKRTSRMFKSNFIIFRSGYLSTRVLNKIAPRAYALCEVERPFFLEPAWRSRTHSRLATDTSNPLRDAAACVGPRTSPCPLGAN